MRLSKTAKDEIPGTDARRAGTTQESNMPLKDLNEAVADVVATQTACTASPRRESLIEWTQATWNALLGCDKISEGCAGCYALKDIIRMEGNPNANVANANKGLAYRQDN